MAGTVIPVGYGQAAFTFQCAGIVDPVITTIGYSTGGTVDPNAHAIALRAAWSNNTPSPRPFAAQVLNNQWTFTGVTCTEMTSTGPVGGTSSVTNVGQLTGDPCPANCAVLVSKRTARGGRKGRGRMYLPAGLVAEQFISAAGVITPAEVTSMQTRISGALADMVVAGLVGALLHSDEVTTPDMLTALQVNSVIGTQRRRLR